MISKRIAITILSILAMGVLLYACMPQATVAQTVPTWVKTGISAGKIPVYKTAVGDRTLSMMQLENCVSLECSGWGRDWEGTWKRVFPAPGIGTDADATSDSTVVFTGSSPFLVFHSVALEVLIVHAGTADNAWGE